MTFEILIGHTGERATADCMAGALLAADVICREYAYHQGTQGALRAARQSVLICELGEDGSPHYAGVATELARQGLTRPPAIEFPKEVTA